MSSKVITGRKGSAHVTAENDAQINWAAFGGTDAEYALAEDMSFVPADAFKSTLAVNGVRVQGIAAVQGRFIEMDETFTPVIPTAGYNLYLLYASYTHDADTGLDSCSVHCTYNNASGTAEVNYPALPESDVISEGGTGYVALEKFYINPSGAFTRDPHDNLFEKRVKGLRRIDTTAKAMQAQIDGHTGLLESQGTMLNQHEFELEDHDLLLRKLQFVTGDRYWELININTTNFEKTEVLNPGYQRVGNLVYIKATVRVTSASVATGARVMATGAPIPAFSYSPIECEVNQNDVYADAHITPTGQIELRVKGANLETGDLVRVAGFYIAQ